MGLSDNRGSDGTEFDLLRDYTWRRYYLDQNLRRYSSYLAAARPKDIVKNSTV